MWKIDGGVLLRLCKTSRHDGVEAENEALVRNLFREIASFKKGGSGSKASGTDHKARFYCQCVHIGIGRLFSI